MDNMGDEGKTELALEAFAWPKPDSIAERSQIEVRIEKEHEGDTDYVVCSVEELRALVNEVKRLRKEVAYLQEALRSEERDSVRYRFRREHDCY